VPGAVSLIYSTYFIKKLKILFNIFKDLYTLQGFEN